MESTNIQDLYDEWQRAVRAHAGLVRDARLSHLTPDEIYELSHSYLLRIDTTFARLKQAEARQVS